MSSSRFWVAALACIALGGCNTAQSHIGDLDPGMGEAVRYNAAIQTINPDPVYAADATQPGSSGQRAADAAKRYRTGTVKEPQAVRTGGAAGGSGSGGGGSGGGGSL